MPYVKKEPRDLVDAYVNEIIWRVRNEYTIEIMASPLRHLTACLVVGVHHRIDFSLLQHAYLSDPIKNLVRTINNEFVIEQAQGVLNYCLTRIIVGSYIPTTPCPPRHWPYARCENVLDVFANAEDDAIALCHQLGVSTTGIRGVYRAAAAEFYRRVVAPKEDIAITENGDVPEYRPETDYSKLAHSVHDLM